MSKKIAAGANKVVLDVTCGSGAFMKNKEDAVKLSNVMKQIGELAAKETVCIITNMNEPLGNAVGNSLEMIETINSLKGNMPEDVKEVVLELGSYILKLAGKGENIEENKIEIEKCINSGKAYKKFIQLVQRQGGDISYCENTEKFEKAKYQENITFEEGYISKINAKKIGKIAGHLGAGRIKKEDKIDMSAGIIINKKVGDYIKKEDIVATLYSNNKEKIEEAKEMIKQAITITDKKVEKEKMILGII